MGKDYRHELISLRERIIEDLNFIVKEKIHTKRHILCPSEKEPYKVQILDLSVKPVDLEKATWMSVDKLLDLLEEVEEIIASRV